MNHAGASALTESMVPAVSIWRSMLTARPATDYVRRGLLSVQGEREEQLLEFAFGHGLITVSGVASHAFSQSILNNR